MRVLLLAALLPLAACGWDDADDQGAIAPMSDGNGRSYQATGFTAVDLRGSDDVDVRVGPGFSVRATGDAKVLDALRVEVSGDTLRIGRRRGVSNGEARIAVTMPTLRGASIAGSGDLTVDRISGAALSAALAGSGSLALGEVAVERAELSIAGSGDISARGSAGDLRVRIAGSGDVDAPGLVARRADVSVAGSGDVRATVKGDASVKIMGSGDADLGAEARCTVQKLGSGTVRCGG